jgi:hypothetical protein
MQGERRNGMYSLDLADLVEEAGVVDAGGVGEVEDAGEAVLLDVGERGVPLCVRLGGGRGEVLLGLERDVPVHHACTPQHLGRGGRVGDRLHDHPHDGRAHEPQGVRQAQQLGPAPPPLAGARPRGGDHNQQPPRAGLLVVVAHVNRRPAAAAAGPDEPHLASRVGRRRHQVDARVDGDAGGGEVVPGPVRRVLGGGPPGRRGGREPREEAHDEAEREVEQRLLPEVAAPALLGPVRRHHRHRPGPHGPGRSQITAREASRSGLDAARTDPTKCDGQCGGEPELSSRCREIRGGGVKGD